MECYGCIDFLLSAIQKVVKACADTFEDKAYRISSCANSEQWAHESIRCHALIVENQLCTRSNTIQSYQEINRLLPHNLQEFDLEKSNITRSKVCVNI